MKVYGYLFKVTPSFNANKFGFTDFRLLLQLRRVQMLNYSQKFQYTDLVH